jgi:hypothetical protein
MGGAEYAGSIAASPYAKKGAKIKTPASCKEMNKMLRRLDKRARRF